MVTQEAQAARLIFYFMSDRMPKRSGQRWPLSNRWFIPMMMAGIPAVLSNGVDRNARAVNNGSHDNGFACFSP